MCKAIGIASRSRALRHYPATELVPAGVDLRTVAGRLGHGGGGVTTLRVYAAWVGVPISAIGPECVAVETSPPGRVEATT
jgi:hypothetical protein